MPTGDEYKGLTADNDLLSGMTPALKAAGLTQGAVDGLVKAVIDYQRGQPGRQLARDLDVTMKDERVGKLNWGRTQGRVNAALAAFTSPEFRSKLERWGIANDLEFVRVFESIGNAMAADTPARGAPDTAPEESRADRIYGRSQKAGNAQ